MLYLVKDASPRDFYARDRNEIINCACGLLGTEYTRPIEALEDVATIMGFTVRRRPLTGKRRSSTVVATRSILVCSRLETKLEHPESMEGVAAFALAQELAHIRLHLFDGVALLKPDHIEEARHYAGVFLVPRRQLLAHGAFHDMLKAGRMGWNLWGYVGELAGFFGVTRGCLVRQLEELGFVIHDRETRTLKLAA
jgi:hypothetical protein